MATLKDLIVSGPARVLDTVFANYFVKINGTSSQFLKADGSVDSNSYALSSSIPTVNNATLTVKGDGTYTSVGTSNAGDTFTANASSNKTITVNHATRTESTTTSTAAPDLTSSTTANRQITIVTPTFNATALSVEEIEDLYHTSAIVDNLGNHHTFELKENEKNILFEENCGIAKKQWIGGLSNYTQTDCQCTLTDDGYRIYRTPNKTYDGTSATKTMYGGFRIINTNNRFNLIKGHSYVFQFDVKGQSTNAASLIWINNLGWGGGGLSPTPTTLYVKNLPTNFISNDYVTISWAFNIPDSIYKTCTSSYSSFVAGTDYVSYRDLCFSYNYASTGELGTDLYIKNIRLIDITNGEHMNIFKDGITDMMQFIEFGNPSKIQKGGVSYANEFIEI